jgi:hypothetical protein
MRRMGYSIPGIGAMCCACCTLRIGASHASLSPGFYFNVLISLEFYKYLFLLNKLFLVQDAGNRHCR